MSTPTTTREPRWGANGKPVADKPGSGASATTDITPDKAGRKRKVRKFKLKSKKGIILLVALLAVGGGAYKFLVPSKPAPVTGGEVVAMDATTLNLAGGHYLKIAVAIQLVKGKATATDFPTSHAAELTIDEFSNRTITSLSTNATRKALTEDLLKKVQLAYPGEVYEVFLTQFVTQ
jgi:flagellar protein FliL